MEMTYQQYRATIIERDPERRCHRCGHLEKQAEQLTEELAKSTRHCQYLELQIAYLRSKSSTDDNIHETKSDVGLYDGWSDWPGDIKDDTIGRKTRETVWEEPSWEDTMAPKGHRDHKIDDDTQSEIDNERKEQMARIMALRRNVQRDDMKVVSPLQEAKAPPTRIATSYQCKEKTIRDKSRQTVNEDRPSTHRTIDAADVTHGISHDIAILSEHHKPDRVGEMYSEIYDNQWTVVFDFMKEYKPKELDIVQTLIKILTSSYDMCSEVSEEQLKIIEESSHFPRSKWTTLEMKKFYLKQVSTPAPIARMTRGYLRDIAKYCIPFIQYTFLRKKLPGMTELRHRGKRIEGEALTEFVNKCVEVTWYMNIQDPPMAFQTDVDHGATFDTNYFRFHSSRGRTMDFVVWPALLLHDDGQVCRKGVAEPVSAS